MIPELDKIYLGDNVATMKTWPDAFVQTSVTSPPYFGLRDYGHDGQIGLEETPEAFVASLVNVFREVRRVMRDDGTLWLNLGDSYATSGSRGGNKNGLGRGEGNIDEHRRKDYMPLVDGFKEKDLFGIPWMVAFALRADGWYLRSEIIWAKKNCMPESVTDRPTKSHEQIFLLSKSPKYFYDHEAIKEPQEEQERTRRLREQENGLSTKYNIKRDDVEHGQHSPGKTGCAKDVAARHALAMLGTRNKRTVWNVGTQPFKEAHFATFPPKLIEPCVLAGAPRGGIVLDPFMGAGTTALVAATHGRRFLGCELNAEYKAIADARVKNEAAQEKLF